MKKIRSFLHKLWLDDEGATAVEYGVLIALIIAAMILVIVNLRATIENAFERVIDAINNPPAPTVTP